MTELTEVESTDVAHLLDVAFLDLNTNETARFAVPGDVTLQRAWDMAYDELGETRRENDVLESRSGQSLTGDLDKTIRYVKEHVVPDLKFQIHGEQGGA
jgi:hypothetical protein